MFRIWMKILIKFLKSNSNLISINQTTNFLFTNMYKTKTSLGRDRVALVSAASLDTLSK